VEDRWRGTGNAMSLFSPGAHVSHGLRCAWPIDKENGLVLLFQYLSHRQVRPAREKIGGCGGG
jgi:hypothetical protein